MYVLECVWCVCVWCVCVCVCVCVLKLMVDLNVVVSQSVYLNILIFHPVVK